MTPNKPQDQELEDILWKFDDDNYNFWLDNNSGRMSLEQWNKGKAKIRNKATQQIKDLLDKRVLAELEYLLEQVKWAGTGGSKLQIDTIELAPTVEEAKKLDDSATTIYRKEVKDLIEARIKELEED